MKRTHAVIACVPLMLILAGCSEDQKPAAVENKAPEKPAEAVTAQTAFHQMFIAARGWAGDVKLLRLGDLEVKDVKGSPGKSGAWEAVFVSERTMRSRRYTYSVVKTPDMEKGASGSHDESWSGPAQTTPIALAEFKIDSVAAYEEALKKGADYAKKHPDLPIKVVLEHTKRFQNPAWRVIWGESVTKSDYSIYIDATEGGYLQTAR